jgi:hypothetical protein
MPPSSRIAFLLFAGAFFGGVHAHAHPITASSPVSAATGGCALRYMETPGGCRLTVMERDETRRLSTTQSRRRMLNWTKRV